MSNLVISTKYTNFGSSIFVENRVWNINMQTHVFIPYLVGKINSYLVSAPWVKIREIYFALFSDEPTIFLLLTSIFHILNKKTAHNSTFRIFRHSSVKSTLKLFLRNRALDKRLKCTVKRRNDFCWLQQFYNGGQYIAALHNTLLIHDYCALQL